MASHQLAIAKASFSAGLLRPDPTSVPRDKITAFHTSLDRALSRCTPANIQTCKSWLLEHVVSSSNRVGGWAKYLAALSGSFTGATNNGGGDAAAPRQTSGKRKQLHILYLLNDVLHHTKYHVNTSAAFPTLSGSLQPHVVELLGYAASYDREKHPKHHGRLDELLDIWDENGYYGSDYVHKLREVVKTSAVSGPIKTSLSVEESDLGYLGSGATQRPPGKAVPYNMPATHGDPSMPFYDLPAGNLVPHIIPDSTVPLRSESIKPLQFLAGPADENLVVALKKFMKDVDRIYGTRGEPEHEDDEFVDIDDLGQTVVRDADGEVVEGETYYGWSRSFCQQMRKRNTKRSSRSRSRSRDSFKRRRYSDSEGSSRSRSRSPRRSRRYDSRSRTRSPSRSRSPSWKRSPSRPRERSQSYSPRPTAPRTNPPAEYPPPPTHHHHPQQQHAPYGNTVPPPPPPTGYHPPPPPPIPYPPPGGSGVPHGFPPGLPSAPPPPPPPNYQGTWPPPPPPSMPNFGPPPGHHAPPHPSHFPPPYGRGQYAQQMPPGSYHFPPPHSGGPPHGGPPPQGGGGRGWGYGNDRGWR
ncbi:hypothetical protein BO71DRAFT_397360 [Aspergillus ellipticus CBS 707.79]|uniref:CID domain-containing protein n=1 Tax=Aspergillus ellipticus CBS 707.79 TaxID=1448320 RepID=A0A319DPS9_9EURO|nr:hypothetical protein BO71DRAFT_397360 [Aspergillus ellipticus CBS 707.79]